jgi:hypothetical protein
MYGLYKKEVNANSSSVLPTSHVKIKRMILLNRNHGEPNVYVRQTIEKSFYYLQMNKNFCRVKCSVNCMGMNHAFSSQDS